MYLTHCRTFSSIHHAKYGVYTRTRVYSIRVYRVIRTHTYGTGLWNRSFIACLRNFFLSLLSQPDTQELTDRSVAIKLPPQSLNSLTLVPMVALVWPASLGWRKKELVEMKETWRVLRGEGRRARQTDIIDNPGERGVREVPPVCAGVVRAARKKTGQKRKRRAEKILVRCGGQYLREGLGSASSNHRT